MAPVRHLTAILAADVAGYSRLMGADEEGTLAQLKALRRDLADPKIMEHHGRIVKTTGDGLLLEFASVVDAVRCAVEVQREMIARNAAAPAERRIEFRMGIDVGDIIIKDGDIFGDGVKIAARLEALAEPGGICLSAAAHDQVRDRLDIAFDDLGEQQVKNITRLVRTYRVALGASSLAALPVGAPLPRPQLIPGREDEDAFAFGSFRLIPARRMLLDDGKPLRLGSRAFDILVALVERGGETIPRDQLIAGTWPDTVVDEGALRVHVAALRKALGDGRAGGRYVANNPGRGYTFVAPVTREHAHADNALADGAALLDKPSLAVLPFQNMSGDLEQDYFVDGMVEEITTAIARLPWLFVIARNSAFTYKGKAVGVKQVARELGVRYVLEGSVRKAGNRVRITGQLIDTTTGAHIWADRFDGALDDIFELQDQVASSVAGVIEPKVRQSEIERANRKPNANLTAYDLYLRALAQSYRFTDEGVAEAVVLARQALAIDPSYAPAAAMVGWCRVLQRAQGWGALAADDIAEACRLARQALEAARDDADTVWQAAYTLFFLAGEAAIAAAALDRALALNPNAAHAWAARGIIHALRYQPEAAIEAIERARRLSPFDPYAFNYAGIIAIAHLAARRFEQAIEWADRALHDQPRTIAAMRVKVAALAYLGHLDAAGAELSRVLAIDPKLTIAGFRAYGYFFAPEVLELYVTGLRLAGLPEK